MESFALVIFGITSNLAQIKLIPALYDMEDKNLLPAGTTIIGVARKEISRAELSHHISQALHAENRHHKHHIKPDVEQRLIDRFVYVAGQAGQAELYTKLQATLDTLQTKNRIFYLATYPDLYQGIFEHLKTSELSKETKGWVRLMIEKPIGNDLASAQALNKLLLQYFDQHQVYRLDHYLGKETLQNILTFRFGNGIFEPMMTREHIDHIQVTAAEDFGIGARGGYYDTVGAFKDVGQNHLLQMIAFATMDAPGAFTNEAITQERTKILQSLVPNPENLVLGQYKGYQQEKNISENSQADTYFAFKTELNTPKLQGVPIYVRGGKKLQQTVTEVSVVFKTPTNRLFSHLDCGDEPNVLIYRIQPNEAIVLKILTKKPGHATELQPDYMQYCYREGADELPDAYEKLIFDAMRGDQTFFNDAEEVEAEWAFTDQILKNHPHIHSYEPGSWGPEAADALIQKDGRQWLEPSMAFCRI